VANSLTAILTSLLALPELDRDRIAELLTRNDKKPMQTTSLRMRPGTRQLIDELSGRLGISQSELLNMIVEGSLRDTFLPFSNTAGSVIDRFELLMQAHELDPTDIAQLLSSWNIRVSVLQDRERTMDYLTTPLLQELATWFHVSADWMLGRDVPPVDITRRIHQWPQTEDEFRALINPTGENKNSDIIFWTNGNSGGKEYKKRTGILIKQKESASQIDYYPVLSILPQQINAEQERWINEASRDYATTGGLRSVSIDAGLATALEQGITLPVLIFTQL